MNRTQRALVRAAMRGQAQNIAEDREIRDNHLGKVKQRLASAFIPKEAYCELLKASVRKMKADKKEIREIKKAVLSEKYNKEAVGA